MKEENFNMIIDESGDTTNQKENPMNYLVGCLIFFEDIKNLENDFNNFIQIDSNLRDIVNNEPHKLKFERIKRYAKVKNLNCDKIFCSILDFFIKRGCKFYFYPIKSGDKNINEKDEERVYVLKFTKNILSYNPDIIANLVLDKNRKNEKIGNIIIYCDEKIWKGNKVGLSVKGTMFSIYLPQGKIDHINYDKHYEFNVKEIKPTNILHQCADIIAGIARENFNIDYFDRPKAYQLLLNNRFADIVETPYT